MSLFGITNNQCFIYLSTMISRFPCQQCDYKAKQKGHLLTHIKTIHEGVKFPCEQCDYKATQKVSILRHVKSKHKVVKLHCE